MPIYSYKCQLCGHADDEYMRMSSIATMDCPKCGGPEYHKQVVPVHSDLKEFHTPIEMFSIALEDQAEIRKMKQQCPDLDLSDDPRDPNYGLPIARTRKAKKQALAAAGFVEKS